MADSPECASHHYTRKLAPSACASDIRRQRGRNEVVDQGWNLFVLPQYQLYVYTPVTPQTALCFLHAHSTSTLGLSYVSAAPRCPIDREVCLLTAPVSALISIWI